MAACSGCLCRVVGVGLCVRRCIGVWARAVKQQPRRSGGLLGRGLSWIHSGVVRANALVARHPSIDRAHGHTHASELRTKLASAGEIGRSPPPHHTQRSRSRSIDTSRVLARWRALNSASCANRPGWRGPGCAAGESKRRHYLIALRSRRRAPKVNSHPPHPHPHHNRRVAHAALGHLVRPRRPPTPAAAAPARRAAGAAALNSLHCQSPSHARRRVPAGPEHVGRAHKPFAAATRDQQALPFCAEGALFKC